MVKSSPRHQARELVLKGLYALQAEASEREEIDSAIVSDAGLGSKSQEFAHALFAKVGELRGWADEQISELAKNWHIDRIAKIDLDILSMGMVEIREFPDIPVNGVINEAIELSKKYSTAESSKFINGVLDSFVKKSVDVGEENKLNK